MGIHHTSPAQTIVTQTYEQVELTFVSSRDYDHPVRDIQVDVALSGPNGAGFSVAAFWDGGRTYRARFALPSAGTWTYKSTASDALNQGLHHRTGDISVTPYTGDDVFKRKGWPRVSESGRYMTYGDGDPLFLLGDTAWEMTWKSTESEVATYLADRSAKGFNVVQLISHSHLLQYPWGIKNQAGEPFVLNEDFSLPNPRYFDYLDHLVEMINDAGMIVSMVPLWGRFIEFVAEELGYGTPVTTEEGLLLARYIGARYAGANVMWIVGGDWKYDEPNQHDFWNRFGADLEAASGGSHLSTVHTTGFVGTFTYFREDAPWLDYYMYQSGHYAEPVTYNWKGATDGYNAEPIRPVLDGEAQYEDLWGRFWNFHDDTTGAVRINAAMVREAAYQSVLSGALTGFIYGANGVWQWSTPWLSSGFGSRLNAVDAIHFPGSTQVAAIKRVFERFNWYELSPRQDLLYGRNPNLHVPVAASDTEMLAYLPRGLTRASFRARTFGRTAVYYLIEPSTGDTLEVSRVPARGFLVVAPPADDDVLLVVRTEAFHNLAEPATADRLLHVVSFPNPFVQETTLRIARPEPGTARVSIVDVLGRLIEARRLAVTTEQLETRFRLPTPGNYFYRVDFAGDSGMSYVAKGTMTAIR